MYNHKHAQHQRHRQAIRLARGNLVKCMFEVYSQLNSEESYIWVGEIIYPGAFRPIADTQNKGKSKRRKGLVMVVGGRPTRGRKIAKSNHGVTTWPPRTQATGYRDITERFLLDPFFIKERGKEIVKKYVLEMHLRRVRAAALAEAALLLISDPVPPPANHRFQKVAGSSSYQCDRCHKLISSEAFDTVFRDRPGGCK